MNYNKNIRYFDMWSRAVKLTFRLGGSGIAALQLNCALGKKIAPRQQAVMGPIMGPIRCNHRNGEIENISGRSGGLLGGFLQFALEFEALLGQLSILGFEQEGVQPAAVFDRLEASSRHAQP